MIRLVQFPETLLSCNIGEIAVLTDHDYLSVSFGTATKTLLSGRFYAYNGTVNINDLRSLVESELNASGNSLETFSLTVSYGNETETASFNAIYCNRDVVVPEVDTLLLTNFLTPASARRIAPGALVFVSWFAGKNEKLAYYVYCDYIAGGKLGHLSFIAGYANVTAEEDRIVSVTISCENVQKEAARLAKTDVDVVAFTVRVDERATSFFIDKALTDMRCFYFRNVFNVPDQIYFPAVTTAKTDVERSVAVMHDTSQFYDCSKQQSFEVQSSALAPDECLLADQLFSSLNVRIADGSDDTDFDAMRQILITESTCEISDFPEKPDSVKFSWRYVNNNISLPVSSSSDIFTNPYNFIFS